ncbi:MAG TPA: hypothetical protein VG713_08825, partial [Pirellulales bacterium]|nr:hypothetical protein [Pirellulales bacterium]
MTTATLESKPEQQQPQQTKAAPSRSTALAVWDRISDPMDYVAKMGNAIASSHMFGCKNLDQGRVLAMACLTERKSPLALMRTYHIIGGNLSMKSDAMLAAFRQPPVNGTHRILSRTGDKASIELVIGKQKQTFEFTWEEAKNEPYVYTSEANDNKVP